jgi:hypothetical protein
MTSNKKLSILLSTNWQLPEALDVPVFNNAACAGMPTEWWFPEKDAKRETIQNTKKAIAICESCPEIRKCQDFAIDNPCVQGIWGGMSVKRRSRARTVIQRFNNMERRHHLPYSEMRAAIEKGPRGPLSI